MYLIKMVKSDITKITDVQAIVNVANNSLLKEQEVDYSQDSGHILVKNFLRAEV